MACWLVIAKSFPNGLLARNHEKIPLVEAFIISNNIDIFCISKTFLDSSVNNIYNGLNVNAYTLARSDHNSNTKRGGEALYYKNHLPVSRRNNIFSLNESIVLEIRLANNKCFPTGLYGSHNQKKDQFDELCSSFNMLMSNVNHDKALVSIITGDFNARSKNL